MKNVISENSNAFTESFTVEHRHLDALKHVNNVVYLQWIQDISEKHWNVLAPQPIKDNYIWVALRHEIDYHKAAFLHDRVKLHTWIGDSYGVKSERFVKIYKGEEVLVVSKTIWCLLHAKNMKPAKINTDILNLLSTAFS